MLSHLFTGQAMWCDLTDEIQRLVYFYGSFELRESHMLSRWVKPGWVAVDVGANVGCYTLLLASLVGESGRVVAVEPIKNNLVALRKNLELNQVARRVTVVDVAVAELPGTLTLHLNQQDASENSTDYTRNVFGPLAASETVDVTTLDDIARIHHLDSIDFIKIDIEGGELSALKGAAKVLRTRRPILMMEINAPHITAAGYTLDELLAFLKDLRYQVWRFEQDDIHRLEEGAVLVRENIFALPAEVDFPKHVVRWSMKRIVRWLALKRGQVHLKRRVMGCAPNES